MANDPATRIAASLTAEHDWSAASRLLRPALRPAGTKGNDGTELKLPPGNSPAAPIVRPAPAGLSMVYAMSGSGFDVVIGVEHLLAWGVTVEQVHGAAMANLEAWSQNVSWVDEVNGNRRVIWSDWGDGMDAARILLAGVREYLTTALSPATRILVGLPERDLVMATALTDPDDEFEAMFAGYIADRSKDADEPIDSRVFELVEGELVLPGRA